MYDVASRRRTYTGGVDQRRGISLDRATTKGRQCHDAIFDPFSNASPTYSPEVWDALERLRARYQQSVDLWTERELAHLRFLRRLAEMSGFVEDGGPAAASNGATGR